MSTPPVPLEAIRFPRSITESAVPPSNALMEGSLAINVKDRTLYSKDENDTVIVIGRDYDAVLTAHFNASNPHGTTSADVGLGNVPNVDLRPYYLIDPGDIVIDTGSVLTRVDRVSPENVTYTIQNSAFDLGDTIEINRCDNTTGVITITLDSGNSFLVRSAISTEDLIMSGGTPFVTIMRKFSETTWIVFVQRI